MQVAPNQPLNCGLIILRACCFYEIFLKLIFLSFSDYFNVMMVKIICKKLKNIILIHFQAKNNNRSSKCVLEW
jgi:hypothetical protein